MNKLNKIRDELVEKGSPRLGPFTMSEKLAFKHGWNSAMEQAKILEEAIKKVVDENWFQPSDDSGVCSSCDGGQDPNFMYEHEPRCSFEQLKSALTKYRGES